MSHFQNIGRSLPGAALLLVFVGAAPTSTRAADLFMNDEPEIYAALDKLNASGLLPGFLANTRPYNLRAVRAAVEEAGKGTGGDPFERETLAFLAEYVGPSAMGRIAGETVHANKRGVPPNGEGIPTPDGWSFQPSLFLREETTVKLNAQLRAKSFYVPAPGARLGAPACRPAARPGR